MAGAATIEAGRRKSAEAQIHAGVQLQLQPHRGQHPNLRPDRAAAALRQGGQRGQHEGPRRDESPQRLSENDSGRSG